MFLQSSMCISRPLIMTRSVCLIIVLSLISLASSTTCENHPLYSKSLKPVLVSRWTFSNDRPTGEQSVYQARYYGHLFTPLNDDTSSKYKGLDLFFPPIAPHNSITMTFQRPAKVYLLVGFHKNEVQPEQTFQLNGWRSVGWAALKGGPPTFTFGIHQRMTKPIPSHAYVFSKTVTKSVLLPTSIGFSLANKPRKYIVLIGEQNGAPSPPVGKFNGRDIPPNTKCPDALHNAWVTTDPNKDDPFTRGKVFRTYHPAWDPCWWCAYDHGHGGNPAVFDYIPLYDYTAFKNGGQDESDSGFKGFVFSFGKYWVYFSLHVQTSSIRRVSVRAHTMNIVVAEKNTNTIIMDVRFKADFGFAAVQAKNRNLLPLDGANQRIRDSLKQNLFRTVNVLDVNNPNRGFLLKDNDLTRGSYEEWHTIPICSKPISDKLGVQFTLKTPGTGILSLERPNTVVKLGRKFYGNFFRNLNLYRTVKFKSLTLGTEFCPNKGGGVFYTDPTGTTLMKGPGPNAVRQFAKPGFKLLLTGKHEVTEPWDGIYTDGKRGFFRDHGFGLNPDVA